MQFFTPYWAIPQFYLAYVPPTEMQTMHPKLEIPTLMAYWRNLNRDSALSYSYAVT